MKVLVLGKGSLEFRRLMTGLGFELVEQDPDVIVAYGGDGTLIGAERNFPGTPKLGIRRTDTCQKCPEHQDEAVLARLKAGELKQERLMLLQGSMGKVRLRAMNDIIIRNADARTAVRFTVSLNGRRVTEEMIGDGLVACTPFGSSAYFRSITRTVIRTGIGLAFNNCSDLLNHLIIREDEQLAIEITRGPAILAADNDMETHPVVTGDRILVARAKEHAPVLAIDTLRCTNCRYIHAPRRRY